MAAASSDKNGKSLTGQLALITGGNTGIGRAVALAYANEGADVGILWWHSEHDTTTLEQEFKTLGVDFWAAKADVSDEQTVIRVVSDIQKDIGTIDILVNNAGIQKSQPITETTCDDFDQMLAVHLKGAFLLSREVAKTMKHRRKGRIINVCSQLGYIGRADYTAYSMAKGGLIAFTRALARELAPFNVLVNGVSPGLVDTGFDPLSNEEKSRHAASLPLGRLGTVDDMTSAFVFLASSASNYYCGQLLHPNGGEIMP